ncbi:hypothetical protein X808_9360 [Mannheimia varigena USDA-ARS-USMARC-1296]|uniref:Uncharacterized protein n=1 Tax=Mannheimia varigena USDA-ARS-USMARC-1296 TaxID=1433287 RepID=W0Q998_9PAST|nr:hypothetical protein [Mannheimia varigena]AHG75459.1 hypothetical protein X808_9360 [Mannheimia varigena USDA-ARS-USMARC-1296]
MKYQELLNALLTDAEDDCFAYYGLRATTEFHDIGDELENSFVWIDGEKTDEELDGVSTMGIKNSDEQGLIEAIKNLGRDACKKFDVDFKGCHSYVGQNFILVKGDSATAGEDKGESVIRNPIVVAVFNQ